MNYPAPGKRPLSSTAPTIIENDDGSLFLVAGGAGGSRIFPSIFQVILNVDKNADENPPSLREDEEEAVLDLSSAVERARVHNQLYPDVVDVDRPLGVEAVEALRGRGHVVECTSATPSLYVCVRGCGILTVSCCSLTRWEDLGRRERCWCERGSDLWCVLFYTIIHPGALRLMRLSSCE